MLALISYFSTLAEYILMYSPFLFVPLLPHLDTGDDEEEYVEMVPSTPMMCSRLVLPSVNLPMKMESFSARVK
jgi:hypothetical protein